MESFGRQTIITSPISYLEWPSGPACLLPLAIEARFGPRATVSVGEERWLAPGRTSSTLSLQMGSFLQLAHQVRLMSRPTGILGVMFLRQIRTRIQYPALYVPALLSALPVLRVAGLPRVRRVQEVPGLRGTFGRTPHPKVQVNGRSPRAHTMRQPIRRTAYP